MTFRIYLLVLFQKEVFILNRAALISSVAVGYPVGTHRGAVAAVTLRK